MSPRTPHTPASDHGADFDAVYRAVYAAITRNDYRTIDGIIATGDRNVLAQTFSQLSDLQTPIFHAVETVVRDNINANYALPPKTLDRVIRGLKHIFSAVGRRFKGDEAMLGGFMANSCNRMCYRKDDEGRPITDPASRATVLDLLEEHLGPPRDDRLMIDDSETRSSLGKLANIYKLSRSGNEWESLVSATDRNNERLR